MRQLSELDASFLYLESDTTPMHIGGIYLFDASGLSNPLAFSTFVAYLRSRLHVVPLFRQKLKEIPLRLGRPYWVDDADFSIERHLAYVNLGEHGKQASLMSLASKILEEPLKRDRPLWHITFVDGFRIDDPEGEKEGFALIVKLHHAAIDAFSGLVVKLPAGLLEEGRSLLEAAENLAHTTRQVAQGWETRLRIGFNSLLPAQCLFPAIDAFYQLGVPVDVQVVEEVFAGAWDALQSRRVDMVIGADQLSKPAGSFTTKPLGEIPFVFAVAASHPLAPAEEPLTESDIAQFPAAVAADTSRALPPGLGPDGFIVEHHFVFTRQQTVIQCQIVDQEVGHAPAIHADHLYRTGRLKHCRLRCRGQLAFPGIDPGHGRRTAHHDNTHQNSQQLEKPWNVTHTHFTSLSIGMAVGTARCRSPLEW